MKVAIVGTGYVGLVTGACFSEVGINATCVDIDEKKIENLKEGILPIYEPGLEEVVLRNFHKKRLHFTTNLKNALVECDVVFIAVGTPPGEDGSADLKYVEAVASQVGDLIDDYVLVVTKSTVPVGTGEKVRAAVQKSLDKRGINIEFGIASNPEFLKEGAAVSDFLKPDRIVVGIDSERAKKLMNRLYKPFVMNGHPVIFMDVASAEMTKYAANSMLATKISFMNDISNLCEIVGADVNLVRQGIGSDTRIGTKFIYPGIGYGGSCFPKDVKALIKTATQHNYSMSVLKAVEEVNERQKNVLYQKVEDYFGGKANLLGRKIALWGLSFKPETDDMREAPSLTIVKQLLEAGCIVSAYDPVSTEEAKHLIGDTIEYCPDQYSALMGADCLMILTEWSEFKFPNFNTVGNLMDEKIIFDGRNIYDYKDMAELGFTYTCMGVNTKSTHPKKSQIKVA